VPFGVLFLNTLGHADPKEDYHPQKAAPTWWLIESYDTEHESGIEIRQVNCVPHHNSIRWRHELTQASRI
jgi:hypothetical protein